MSITLDGSTQYVSLGDAVDVRSATPLLLVAVVQTSAFVSGLRAIYGQGDYNANTGWGFYLYSGPPKNSGYYVAPSGGSTFEGDGTAIAVPSSDGWYLLALKVYVTNTAPHILFNGRFAAYSYTHGTWTADDGLSGPNNLSVTSAQAPSAGQTTVIGALTVGSIGSFWSGAISWLAVFNNDGGATTTNFKDTAIAAELIANGAWNLLDANCKLFIPFNGSAADQSGNGHNGTLVGSPSYSAAGPGEIAPGGGITGNSTTTQGAQTGSAGAAVLISGNSTVIQAANTGTASGSSSGGITGTSITIQAGDVASATGALSIVGTSSTAQGANIGSATGHNGAALPSLVSGTVLGPAMSGDVLSPSMSATIQ
jgi:hypothetical protein